MNAQQTKGSPTNEPTLGTPASRAHGSMPYERPKLSSWEAVSYGKSHAPVPNDRGMAPAFPSNLGAPGTSMLLAPDIDDEEIRAVSRELKVLQNKMISLKYQLELLREKKEKDNRAKNLCRERKHSNSVKQKEDIAEWLATASQESDTDNLKMSSNNCRMSPPLPKPPHLVPHYIKERNRKRLEMDHLEQQKAAGQDSTRKWR